MQRGQATVQRIVRRRNPDPLVPCQFGEQADRLNKVMSSCGAMIPSKPRKPCPECGQQQIKAHAPAPKPGDLIIDGNAALVDEESGQVVAVQAVTSVELANRLGDALRAVKWNSMTGEARLSGIRVSHRTFGFVPPVPLRRRYACSRSRFDYEHPEIGDLLGQMCVEAEHVFRTLAPEVYDRTAGEVRDLIPRAWLIAGTPWTSGIINNTAALPYHKDSGNVKGSWSAMLASRRNVDGGYLHLADYDCWLTTPNGSISIFDGQSVLHGVTPFRLAGSNAYRYTLVTYARKGMKVCCPDPAREPQRAAQEATRHDASREASK